MTNQEANKSLSPSQHMARALFHIAKRAWFADQQARWPRKEPPDPPVPGEAWYADPATLRIQVQGISPPQNEGTSVKIDPNETDLSKAFRPRPFLIVSNENVLDQGFAWVCPLSSSAEMRAFGSLPEWIVRIPELDTYCLTAKLHTIDTEFFPDVAERELLHAMKIISDESMRRVRAALLRHLAGDFAPKQDPLPPGSIVRHRNGTERMVVANCYLGDLYRGAGTLSTTCLLERAADVPAEDRTRPVQDLVPYPEGAPKPTGFVDLVDLRSENQPRLVKKCVGEDATALNTMRAAFRTLVLGTDAGGAP